MKKNKKWIQIAILSAVVILGALTLANSLFKSNAIPKAGDKAPEFKLAGLDGQVHKLSDYKGKTVVLNFWGTFCKPCKEEMPDLEKQYQEWATSDVVVLGANVMGESAVTVRSYAEQVRVTFPILLDPQDETRKKYGVSDFPTTFFIDKEGKVRKIKVGQMNEAFIRSTLAELTGK